MGATADNSGYAVHYRSPKPFATLRASHTRKTLSEIQKSAKSAIIEGYVG